MNTLDTIVLVIFGYCVIRGFFRGIIKEISSIVGVICGYYGAYTYYGQVAEMVQGWVANPGYAKIIGFVVVFCGVFIAVNILGLIIRYFMNVSFLGWIDRIFGFAFGTAKAVLVASILVVMLTAFLPKGAPLIRDSVTAPYISRVSEWISMMISKEMKFEYEQKIRELKKHWNLPI
ncbi:MAG: CvpA family protein [Thermodesulfobacteriota bacterium]